MSTVLGKQHIAIFARERHARRLPYVGGDSKHRTLEHHWMLRGIPSLTIITADEKNAIVTLEAVARS